MECSENLRRTEEQGTGGEREKKLAVKEKDVPASKTDKREELIVVFSLLSACRHITDTHIKEPNLLFKYRHIMYSNNHQHVRVKSKPTGQISRLTLLVV